MGTVEYNKYRFQYNEETEHALLMIQNHTRYLKLVEDIFFIYRTIGYPQQELEKSQYADILKDPLLKDVSLALNSNAKSSYYFVYTLYYLGLNQIEKAAEIVHQQVKVYESNSSFLEAHLNTYISILNNLLVLQTQLDDNPQFQTTLSKIREVPEKYALSNKFIERRIFESSYSAELDFYIIKGLISEMAEVIPIVEENVIALGKEGVSFDRFLNLALRVAIYYYRQDDIERAHYWVKLVVENEGSQSTVHIIAYATLLDLILHFKLGDFEYLQYRITTVSNLFKKHKRLIKVNDLFLKTLKQLLRSRDMENVQKVLNVYREQFDECPDSLTKRYYSKYLAIESWLEDDFGMAKHLTN